MNLEFEIALDIAHRKIDELQRENKSLFSKLADARVENERLRDALAEVIQLIELYEDYVPNVIHTAYIGKRDYYQGLLKEGDE